MQLNPGSYRYVTYQISQPTDLGTPFYVQVVVKNTKTLVTLFTLKLVSQGNGLYTGSYQLPADSSGLGYQVVEIASVYTDPSYTQLSPNYQIVAEVIDVNYIAPAVASISTGGMYEDQTDYIKIAELLALEIGNIPKTKFSTKKLEEMIQKIFESHYEHHQQMVEGFNGHRDFLNKGLQDVNKNFSGINESISKIPLASISESLGHHFEKLHGRFGELMDRQNEIINQKEKPINAYKESLNSIREQFEGHMKQTKKDIADTMDDYFSSVDTMTVTKGVPKRERQADPMEPWKNLAKGMV